ncbi:protein kinase [Streptomyces luteolifulvus]|uniref:non-specific serine/threonine protein kinase n=1 Tax=Streptomyces luteolifulvus TaxID=2615112 RepID=A0A643JPZ7_9ACTN|nr:serine/threonine-protein kinase [Streptomyces luteolifulvus]KAB1140164.1 protein kinase [Streptomyces luteolifulvus]
MNEGETGRRVIDGRFELESRLGGGGMGTVWRARDLLLHRSVAIKEVRPPDVDLAEHDPAKARMLRERVLREARALARVEHPNVVTIHHIVDGGEGTYPWLVMELVEGGSLADRLARGPMAPAEAARIGRGVLDALRAAHEVGVQHRDVKPANVLLRTDGRPVLTDFGIAAIRESTTLTATGSIIGTPDYMAPERISGDGGGPAADLWSLAMMMYVAVEGHHPLQRGTTLATLAAVLNDPVPPPVRAGSLTPVISQVLVRDPAARPDAATLDRMLAAAAQAGDHQQPTPYPLVPPAWPTAPNSMTGGTGYPASPYTPHPSAAPGTWGPQDAPPPHQPPPPAWQLTTNAIQTDRSGQRPKRSRRVAVASSTVGVVLVGTLTWIALPDGNDAKKSASPSAATTTRKGGSTPKETTPTAPTERASTGGTSSNTTNLLTPDGIRTAIKAIEEETGRDSFGDFTVYPEYVSTEVMVKGSRTKYDTYTYYVGRGVEKGIIKGTLSGGDEPVSLENFNWDAVPALLKRAENELKVEKPTSRYLVVRQPNNIFDEPAGMAVYLSDEYGAGGYIDADTQGKVTKVMPSDG